MHGLSLPACTTGSSLAISDSLFFVQGKYAEAEHISKQVLTTFKNKLGSHHIEVATTLNNLASIFLDQVRDVLSNDTQ